MDKLLSEVVKLSPVDVKFVKVIMNRPHMIGVYWSNRGPRKKSIAVVERLDIKLKIATLLHEIGHANCAAGGCPCAKVVSSGGELHAESFTLQWLLDNRHKSVLRMEMKHLNLNWPGIDNIYSEAYDKLIKTKLWKDCKRYVRRWWIR